MTTKLSVCVTTYRRAPLLDLTLGSLSAQTRMPDELIVSDDCSPDETTQIVEKWQGRFPRLLYNRNPRNLNMPGNLNAALALASGEYVANLHDADLFHPTLLEKWELAMDNNPSAGFVFCGIGGWPHKTAFGDGIILHDVAPLTPGRTFFDRYFLHSLSSIVWGTAMARQAAYAKLLPFDATYGFISDVDMWMRMCLNYDVAYVREPLIILDHSPSDQRRAGVFNWKSLDHARKMQVANINRFYGSDPERVKLELAKHQRIVQLIYLRRLLGRVRQADWAGFKEGLTQCRNLSRPMKWAGVLGGG